MSVEALISTQVVDTTTVGRALMTAVDASGARTTLGLGSLATQSGTFSGTSSGTNTGDQTIALTGDVTGTGTGSFVATIGALKVTNAMLAGSIAASNLVGTDIATLGTVTAGTLSTGAVIAGVTITVGSDATGDLYYRNASGVFTRLGIGSAAQVLTVTGGLPSWAASSGLSGTGAVDNAVLRADGTGGATLQSSAFTIADLATASPNNTVNNVSMAPTGGTTNVSVSIVPKGTGAFCLAVPDSAATGGNARGTGAVDLQTSRTAAAQVASGANSFVAGIGNTASGNYSAAGGQASVTSGQSSFGWGQGVKVAGYGAAAFGEDTETVAGCGFASGHSSLASGTSTRAHASAFFANRGTGNIRGSAQIKDYNLAASAAPGIATEVLCQPGGSAALNTRNVMPNNTMQTGIISIQAISSDGSLAAYFIRQYAAKNIANTVTEVLASTTIGTDVAAGSVISVTADNTNKQIKVTFTAPSGTITGITGVAVTDIITAVGHGLVDAQEIAFAGLSGGAGLVNDTLYFVRDATANTFKVTTLYPTNTAKDFTTDILSGTVGYMWNVNAVFRLEEVKRGF